MDREPGAGQLEDFVAAFESAWARGLEPELADFLPTESHPQYRQVLMALVGIDLRRQWERGRPKQLPDYQELFPTLRTDADALERLAAQVDRLRQSAPGTDAAAPPVDGNTRVLSSSAQVRLEEVALSYQQFRLRCTEPDAEALESWCATIPGGPEHAAVFRDVHRSDPQAAYRLAEALTSLPRVGTTFLGFRLIAELGRGAFARVFFARQGDLADRPVALKVAAELAGETQALAQLQHTNIVPIYSVHRAGPLHAVCMPYFGRITLADVLRELAHQPRRPDSGNSLVEILKEDRTIRRDRTVLRAAPVPPARDEREGLPPGKPFEALLRRLEGLSYVEAILSLAARLVDGLAHAHERGILHRDLKPANVLLTDEGQPMLLDFNLAEDIKLRSSGTVAQAGGTLPYMSPEQIRALTGAGRVDVRSDLYSLGVILYELLTGRHPFEMPLGTLAQAIIRMLEDREKPPPLLRPWNPAISPATESIVRHCLEPDPARRYQSAEELREDLQRQLKNRPLQYAPEPSLRERARKWVRRHPRLTARLRQGATLLALLATVWVTWLLVQERISAEAARQHHEEAARRAEELASKEELARREKAALETYRSFLLKMRALNDYEDELNLVRGVLSTAPTDPARRARAEELLRQALDLYKVPDDRDWARRPEVTYLSEENRAQLGQDLGYCLYLLARLTAGRAERAGPDAGAKDYRSALELNRVAESCYPQGKVPQALLMQRDVLLRRLGQEREARQTADRAKELLPRTAKAAYLSAYENAASGRFADALPLVERAARDEPGQVGPWFLLAVCHDNLLHDGEAIKWYTACVARYPDSARSYFGRGGVHIRRSEWDAAAHDFSEVLRLRPGLADALANRAFARHGQKNLKEELRDLSEALRNRPDYVQGYFVRAEVHEQLGDKNAAAEDRAEGFRRQPDDEEGHLARARARLPDDPEAALKDIDRALGLNPRSLAALDFKAGLLADRLNKPREAINALDRALDDYPHFARLLVNRGTLFARLGQRERAIRDAEAALSLGERPMIRYQVACVFAQTSRTEPKDRQRALEHLAQALRGGFGLDRLATDRDLEPLRSHPDFRSLVEALSTLPPPRP
ncbi:MAG TPA: serine/threonine-protein kinase [Gemmataceae bacterium]|nr:serine/threonine-protein kinase [Gemmataceae bacterium]